MIERIYIDNFRTFVNFEWHPQPLSILLGKNGTGKTILLDLLRDLQAFLMGSASCLDIFSESSRTRWDSRNQQSIELDIRYKGGLYRYRLVIDHDEKQAGSSRVAVEALSFNGQALIAFEQGRVRLFQDDGKEGPVFSAKTTRSGIGAVEPAPENQYLAGFKEWAGCLWVLRPDPRAMDARVERRNGLWLAANALNFSSWYLKYLAEKPGSIFKASGALGHVLPGFEELHEQGGYLWARFGPESSPSRYRFDELSDGQRALIALYVLRYAVAGPGKILAIDEPDNYVSLREIQPWLMEIMDLALSTKGGPQVWLISHHPEVLDLLAVEYGFRFFREENGPSRIERFKRAGELSASETVVRGWDDAE